MPKRRKPDTTPLRRITTMDAGSEHASQTTGPSQAADKPLDKRSRLQRTPTPIEQDIAQQAKSIADRLLDQGPGLHRIPTMDAGSELASQVEQLLQASQKQLRKSKERITHIKRKHPRSGGESKVNSRFEQADKKRMKDSPGESKFGQ